MGGIGGEVCQPGRWIASSSPPDRPLLRGLFPRAGPLSDPCMRRIYRQAQAFSCSRGNTLWVLAGRARWLIEEEGWGEKLPFGATAPGDIAGPSAQPRPGGFVRRTKDRHASGEKGRPLNGRHTELF